MRAVRGKNDILCLIHRDEAALFNKTEFNGFLDMSSLTEREHMIAEELHKRNVLQKVKRENRVGFKTYNQKSRI